MNLYEDVSLSSRKISAYDCLRLSFVGDVFLRITGQAHVPRELMTQLPNHLLHKWQTAKRGGGIAALLRLGLFSDRISLNLKAPGHDFGFTKLSSKYTQKRNQSQVPKNFDLERM